MEPAHGSVCDAYGFRLQLMPHEQQMLKACRSTAQKRAARNWARDLVSADRKGPLKRKMLLSLKQACRKVPTPPRKLPNAAPSSKLN
jgi:hypothetical protein